MCRLYGVTRAGYYAGRLRGPSRRTLQNDRLLTAIRRAMRPAVALMAVRAYIANSRIREKSPVRTGLLG